MRDDIAYLRHILDGIARIESYSSGGRGAFLAQPLIQDAVLRNLHTLSESTQRLSDRLKAAYPQVPWEDISGFRNVLVHDYMMIDLLRIWRIVQHSLPELKPQAQEMLADLGGVER